MARSKPAANETPPAAGAPGAGGSATALGSPFASLTGVTRQSLNQQVYESLHQAVASGYFAPGQAVPLRAVANALGVSTMPVREAVKSLVAIGALELLENRRVRVPLVTAERYRDLIVARSLIEAATADAAARVVTDATLEALAREHEEMCEISDRPHNDENIRAYLAHNQTFHFLIYDAVSSHALIDVIQSLWVRAGPFFHILHKQTSDWRGNDNHARILSAMQRHDPAEARAAVHADIAGAADHIVGDTLFQATDD
ncbi:GntR family transcriptional regulator [Pikeienuella sp. HZG-20]|uniref:GntR family transcriptional regulator n=1 Tax=Paludibacillus litoralis TaxID=3133267 RepID=UPI0030EB2BF4